MSESLKKRVFFYFKIGISVLILYFVFRKIDMRSVFINFGKIKVLSILLLLITAAIKIYFQLINWGKYLKINPDYNPQKYEITRSFFIGEALRFLVPGGYGTIGKVYFVENQKKATFVSIGLEKFLQIWTSLVFASLAAIFYFTNYEIIIKISGFSVILILPFIIPPLVRLSKHQKMHLFSQEYNKIIIPVIARHTVTMLLTIMQYYIVITTFNSIALPKVFMAVPLILSANIIPITVSGLGLREGFAIEVLQRYSITADVAVACSLTIFVVNNIIPALIGAYFLILHKKKL